MNNGIEILLNSDLYEPKESLTNIVKSDEYCINFFKEANDNNLYHIDINTLLHIHLYNPRHKISSENLLNRIIERFNEE